MDPNNPNLNLYKSQLDANEQLFWPWQQFVSSFEPTSIDSTANRTSLNSNSLTSLYPESRSAPVHGGYMTTAQDAQPTQPTVSSVGIQQALLSSSSNMLQTRYPIHQANLTISDQNIVSQTKKITVKKVLGRDRYRFLTEGQKFAVFVRVLFKVIERSNDQPMLYQAKTVVSRCTQRNRMGDTMFMPLRDAILIRLRRLVGENYWTRAKSVVVGR